MTHCGAIRILSTNSLYADSTVQLNPIKALSNDGPFALHIYSIQSQLPPCLRMVNVMKSLSFALKFLSLPIFHVFQYFTVIHHIYEETLST